MNKVLFASLVSLASTSLFGLGWSLGLTHAQEPTAAADGPIAGGSPDQPAVEEQTPLDQDPWPLSDGLEAPLGDPWRAAPASPAWTAARHARRPRLEGTHHAPLV